MSEIYGKERQGDLELRIIYDENPESPRAWDNVGKMICWHSRYSLGDKHDYSSPRDTDIPDEKDFLEEFSAKERKKWNMLKYPDSGASRQEWADFNLDLALTRIVKDLDAVLWLPLYLYDHSGITISAGPFSCLWDSGQVGWIFAPRKAVLEGWGGKRMTKSLLKKVEKCLQGEVEVYDQYLRGEVYGFKTVKYTRCDKGCEHEEVLDSCWGFLGDLKESGMRDHLDEEFQPLFDKIA